MTEQQADVLEDHTAAVRSQVPILEAMGISVVRLEPGVATVEAPLEPNLNHVGIFYAGSLFSLAEVLGGLLPGVTWEMSGYVPIVADVQIRFRRPAKETIRATTQLPQGEIDRVAAQIAAGDPKIRFTLTASLTDLAGTEVATSTGQYVLLALT